MSKNQRSCDISGDKKTQLCLPTPITLPSSGRDKIEFQFAVPKYRRTHSCRFRVGSPVSGGRLKVSQSTKPSTEFFAKSSIFLRRLPIRRSKRGEKDFRRSTKVVQVERPSTAFYVISQLFPALRRTQRLPAFREAKSACHRTFRRKICPQKSRQCPRRSKP